MMLPTALKVPWPQLNTYRSLQAPQVPRHTLAILLPQEGERNSCAGWISKDGPEQKGEAAVAPTLAFTSLFPAGETLTD